MNPVRSGSAVLVAALLTLMTLSMAMPAAASERTDATSAALSEQLAGDDQRDEFGPEIQSSAGRELPPFASPIPWYEYDYGPDFGRASPSHRPVDVYDSPAHFSDPAFDEGRVRRVSSGLGVDRAAPQTGTNEDCGLPVFIPGADTPDTTRHIDDAIAGRKPVGKQPSILKYAGPGGGPGRGWTRGDPRCIGRGAAQWCDEYPFQSTLQAGPGASLELVPAWEQRIQSGKLSSFYSACGLSAGDDFLVTPSFAAPVTTWIC